MLCIKRIMYVQGLYTFVCDGLCLEAFLKCSGETHDEVHRENCLQWSNCIRLNIEDLYSSSCYQVSLWYS